MITCYHPFVGVVIRRNDEMVGLSRATTVQTVFENKTVTVVDNQQPSGTMHVL